MEVRFLGQNITIGRFAVTQSASMQHCAILEVGTSFSILQYFTDKLDAGETSAVSICKDDADVNVFALAYNYYDDGYGPVLTTWIKWARDDSYGQPSVVIADDDTPPASTYDPNNGWTIISTFVWPVSSLAMFIRNSFTFYMLDENAYPFWDGSNNTDYTFAQIIGTNSNIYICWKLLEEHDNVYEYKGNTPLLAHGSALTNWIDNNTTVYPTYTMYGIGIASFNYTFPYNPLNITDTIEMESFTDDTSTGNWGYSDYGIGTDNVGPSDPMAADVVGTGLVTMYKIERSACNDLAQFLWSDTFINNVKKCWTEPLDSIIMFGAVPVNLAPIAATTATEITVGGVSTGVNAYKLNHQRRNISLGSVRIRTKYGCAMDYEPYVRAMMYLPFVGFVPLKANDIMDATVSLTYNIDFLSGDTIAFINIQKNNAFTANLDSVLYEHHGNCLVQFPLSARDFSSYYTNMISAAGNLVTSAATGNIGGAINGLINAATAAMQGPDVQRSGSYSGAAAALGNFTPYIIVEYPNQQFPANYGKYIGFPSYITLTLSECSGFTVADAVIDNTVAATDTEKAEIERLLKEGVII